MTDNTATNPMEENGFDLTKITHLAIEHWYLFVISLVLCLSSVYTYLWYAEPMFEMATTVLIEESGNDISQSIMDEIGFRNKKRKNIENEIAILSSRSLMERAIETIDLNINYRVDKGLIERDLYTFSPINLKYDIYENVVNYFQWTVQIDPSGNSAVIHYSTDETTDESEAKELKVTFGESFSISGWGEFVLDKTAYFNQNTPDIGTYILSYSSCGRLASSYMTRLSITYEREKSSILRLSMRDNVRQRGVDVLNAVLNVYIQDNIENKNQLATNSLKFIDGQLEGITKELKLLESDIKLFKVENSVSNISSEAEFYLKQAGELDKIVSEIDVKLSVINYLESYVNDNGNLINASPTSLGIQDPLLVTLISKLSQLTAERESLLEFTKVDNPLIASLDVKIQETRKSLAKNVQSIRSGLLASKKELKGQLSSVERKVSRLPKAEYELLGLQRQYAIQESLYLMLLEKKSESSIILASTVSDHKVVDAARAAARPISPKKKNLYILGLAAGIGIPGMYLLLIVLFDNRIKDVDELKRATNIPLLGIIPHHTESSYLVVNNNSNSAIGESFRSIRTNLSFMIDPKELADGVSPKVIQLTSAMGSEGKSFCSINLSASLALGGAKTIVVGLDLRKPKLAEYFGMSNAVGASSVLAGLNALDEAIVKTEVENLDVLVAGPIPPNPSELLMGKSLAAMLNQLTKDYDSVVLDTPPIGLVTDSLIISEHAATSIYVVRQNTTNTSSMLYVNDLYNSGKMKSVSLLFNDVKLTRFGYGYGYGYGYGNGYYAESGPKGIVDRIREAIFQ